MSINEIIISIDSFHSKNKHAIISSNNQYLTKLFQKNIHKYQVSQDALASYYIDYYLSHILHGGFSKFTQEFSNKAKTLYYIEKALETVKSKKHLALFQKVFSQQYSSHALKKFDVNFKKIQKTENLLQINHKWLLKNPSLIVMQDEYIEKKLQEHLLKHRNETRHIQIIKQLCQIINEEFITITAGDIHNLYHKAWHFSTTKGNYYLIEKENIVTMYNGFTKNEVLKGRLIANKTEASSISSFISKMLA